MLKEGLRENFFNLLDSYPNATKLLENISKEGEILLFGGAVRAYYENRFQTLPRDFDLVIKPNKNSRDLESYFSNFEYRKNRYDGYKVFVDGLEFDIWTLENTWAFKEKKVRALEENLSETVFLNVDSIVYNINKDILYDEKFRESMDSKVLDVVLQDNPFTELNLLRALIFKKKYRMKFSDRLKEHFREFSRRNDCFNVDLFNLQYSHYGEVRLSQDQIDEEVYNLRA
ncbi:hypothetical protein ACLZHR_26470 [Priestia aryabhattai]|uniref:hypothetical protein n=1 Tax=Priestia aryabhattai TaxID=412384 RepID=UPI002E1AD338|nr:hypothetical protein [Priestia aryabhattai]